MVGWESTNYNNLISELEVKRLKSMLENSNRIFEQCRRIALYILVASTSPSEWAIPMALPNLT